MCCQHHAEQEVYRLLFGDEDDIVEAIRRLDQDDAGWARDPVCGTVRRQFPGLSPDQLADCWGDTLMCLAKLARGKELTDEEPLPGFLYTIMRCRAIDALRIVQRRPRPPESLAGDCAEMIASPPCRHTDPLILEELLVLIVEAAWELEDRQRQAWLAYVRLGLEATQTELAIELSALTGVPWSGKRARKALDDGRPKIQECLRQRGYGCEFPEDR